MYNHDYLLWPFSAYKDSTLNTLLGSIAVVLLNSIGWGNLFNNGNLSQNPF